ncbi:MAG: Achromobacter phage Mano [Planctomycetota bacterium]|jgi:hypothetical protein
MIDFPAEIRAGLTFKFRDLCTAYPADDGWVLKVALRGPAALDLTSTPDGATHVLEAAAATTAGWAPGTYGWAGRYEDGAEVVDAGAGTAIILPNLAAVTAPVEARSHAERTLTLIELAIEGRIPKDQESYRIGNRELTRIAMADLVKLRSHYRLEVARERRARSGHGGLMGQNVRVRF